MNNYDIAVIGAGAAGTMAAIRAGQLKKRVVLIERNEQIARKVLLTGKGRCNITNTAPMDVFIKKFGKRGEFYRTAFHIFSNDDLIDFLKSKGLGVRIGRQGRVFPVTDKAGSVVDCLMAYLVENSVEMLYNMPLLDIVICDQDDRRGRNASTAAVIPGFRFLLKFDPSAKASLDIARDGSSRDGEPVEPQGQSRASSAVGGTRRGIDGREDITAKKVILATGGKSYSQTGSTGDGFAISERLGHTVVPLKPGLVPLKTKEGWVKDLQGLALENIRITFECGRKKLVSEIGELMFTHFGVSGPLVLDLSGEALNIAEGTGTLRLFIDLKPGLNELQLEQRIVKELAGKGNISIKNFMKDFLPKRLIEVFLDLASVKHETKTNQLTQGQRRSIIKLFKALPLMITGSLPVEEAMVTGGGVSTKDIDPRTMESKRVKGLYFAGEIIDGAAASGGYNLQQAFSTGYLAGQEAAKCAN